jgi:hypothetical protein
MASTTGSVAVTTQSGLPEMLVARGCVDVHSEAFTVVVEDPDSAPYALPHWLRSWKNKRAIEVTEAELGAWTMPSRQADTTTASSSPSRTY